MTSTSLAGGDSGRPLADHSQPAGKYVSHSQLAQECGYALRYSRERVPWPSRSIALCFGTALHAGLENWLFGRDLTKAIAAANRELLVEVGKMPEVRFDSRQRRGSRAAAIPDTATAETMLRQCLTAWHTTRKDQPFRVIGTEKTIWLEINRPAGWRFQARIDAVIETEDGAKVIWDFKTTGKSWTAEKVRHHASQAHLYFAAELRDSGRAPDYFEFITFQKGTEIIESHRVEFDIAAINRYVEHIVRPTIRTIEANAYIPNVNFWGHSPLYCSYWNHCPLGAAAAAAEEKP